VSEARLAGLFDTALVGIFFLDEGGRILTVNKAFERLFGYPSGEIVGADLTAVLLPEGAGDVPPRDVLGALSRAPQRSGREVRGRHRDGTVLPLELSLGEVATPEGRQHVGILRDLRSRLPTELRLAQLQFDLLRMARLSALDEMAAALAHELNQPLTALMLYLQAVGRIAAKAPVTPLSEMAGSILDKAVGEAERAGSIVQRMRYFVGHREPVRRLVDVNSLVEDAADLVVLSNSNRPGTRVARMLAPDLPPVHADPVQIQQVVANLLRNALDAVRDRQAPDVRVATAHEAGAVVLTVADNGPGIAPDRLPDLFTAFSSLGAGEIGLGLPISKSIAQAHGGDLTVDPGGDGRGACFRLQLPVARGAAREVA
jgi:two-component system sensor kinase FixL